MLILSGAAFGEDAAGQDTNVQTADQGAPPQGVSTDEAAGQDASGEAAAQDSAPQIPPGVTLDESPTQGTTTTGQGITAEGAAEAGGTSAERAAGAEGRTRDGEDAARAASENAYGQGRVNINTATKSELILVPGINRSLADNIIQYRNSNGPFNTVDDLADVQGMDQKTIDEIRSYTKVRGQTDIQPDLIRSQQSTPFPDNAPEATGSPQ